MKKTDKIHLTQEKETLLITLYAKALDSRLKYSVLHDNFADDMVKSIDYDFSKFKSFGSDNIIVVRAKQYDEWLKEFLKLNTNAIVLNLGCGLDTRVRRISPTSKINWFDVDFPEVIDLRKNFYSDKDEYKMIASSVTDLKWLEEIPRNRPTIIIAEGLLEYLSGEEVKTLLNRLTDHFSHGQMMFDVMSSFAIQSAKSNLKKTTGAIHKWEVNKPDEVDKLNPRLKRIIALSLFDSRYIRNLPFEFRLLYGFMSCIPRFKNMIRLMRYDFN